ncbi:MAG: DUF5906 domain-containing protein [Pyrobaculum sp.]
MKQDPSTGGEQNVENSARELEAVQRAFERESGIEVKSIVIKPVAVTKNEVWLKSGDKMIKIRHSKRGGTRISIIGDTVEAVYKLQPGMSLDCRSMSIVVDDVDICDSLSNIVNNFDEFVEQYEDRVRAHAARTLDYVTVPKLATDWQAMIYSLMTKLMSRRIIKTFMKYEADKETLIGIYCFENGYYRECEEALRAELEKMIEKDELINVKVVPQLSGHVISRIRDKTKTEYKPAVGCLLFKDKVFCWDKFVKTGDIEAALLDPDPDLIVTHRIPWRLNTSLLKRRPGLLKFIPPENVEQLITLFKELAPKSYAAFYAWVRKPEESEEDTVKRVALLLEGIGYTLYPHAYPFHKAYLLLGGGSNGKSTYLQLIKTILSSENVASVNLRQLDPSFDRFATGDLYGKLANLSTEPIRGTFDPTVFKQLTGEDLIRFDRKYKEPITGFNYAKMFFAANELPTVSEDTYAFWRRWVVVEFPNRFSPDPTFFERTFTPEEIEAIILLSLYAFRLVLIRKSFSEVQTQYDIKTMWMSYSNPVYPVIKRMLEDGVVVLKPDGYIIKSDLYALYKAYVSIMQREGEDVDVLQQKNFTVHLTRFFPIRAGNARVLGKVRHVYWGIAINDYERVKELIGQVETPPPLM